MNRTALSSLLTAAAVAIPCAAWWTAGSAELERRLARLEEEPAVLARSTARRFAQDLSQRLESLRRREGERPYYHYQRLIHDPRSVATGLNLSPSPLVEGPSDPFIHSYFQVDPKGTLTSPSVAALDVAVLSDLAAEIRSAPRLKAQAPDAVQVVAASTLAQNAVAQAIEPNTRRVPPRLDPSVGSSRREVAIPVGAFVWRTLSPGRAPRLACTRRVESPAGTLLQGFDIDTLAVNSWLETSTLPAQLRPGPASTPADSPVAVSGATWHVTADPTPLLAAIESQRVEARRVFLQTFWSGSALAALVGLLVVLQVRRAERTAAERSRFAASAAHELKTPLAGIRMYADMLAEGLGDTTKRDAYARQIAGEAERLGRIVQNVLGLSRLERGVLAVKKERADLGEAVSAIAKRLEPALAARGVRVVVDIEAALAPVAFDRDALEQILQNLFDNAEKYGREAADRRIMVRVRGGRDAVAVSVEDHGPGVPESRKSRLFEPFVRDVGEGAPAGLGLGLAMVRALAQAHGGDAAYEPAEGGGARFTVTFPA